MEASLLTSLPLWVINLTIGGLVYLRAPRHASHQAFAGFVLTLVMWSVCVKMVYLSVSHPWGIVVGRLAFTAGSLAGTSFVLFSQVFPERQRFELRTTAKVLVCFGALIAGLTFTPLVLQDVRRAEATGLQPHYGSLYPLFGIFLLTAFGYGFKTLVGKWRTAHGRSKLQMQYLALGLGLLIGGATVTNLLIPALFHTSAFSAYGPYFTLCFVGLTAHAIIRHRLMDVRLIICQGVTYLVSLGITVGLMWSVFFAVSNLLRRQTQSRLDAWPLLIAAGGIVVFHPLRLTLQRLLDKYCYRETCDYRQATSAMSQELASQLQVQPLCDYLVTFLRSTLKVETVAVYLCHQNGKLVCTAAQDAGDNRAVPTVLFAPALVVLMGHLGTPVTRDDIERELRDGHARQVIEGLAALQSELLVPLCIEHRLTALITIGEKLSGDPFYAHDLAFLTTVGHQASVALRRAQLHEEVLKMEEEKRRIERLASIGAFASGIAHEIKNPLVAIRTLAELLPEQYDDAEFRDTFTKVALQEVERIDTLVRRLRTLGASSPLHMRPISVLEPLEETLALLSGECTKRHIQVARVYQEPLPPVHGDHDQLKQVFVNLCMNSIEAMQAYGTLTVTVALEASGAERAPLLAVRISDTGPGIPADDLPRIFEPFVTSKETGSGLGLAICKGIIEYHRGTLQAMNNLDGPGATFMVRLPTVQEEDIHAILAAPHGDIPAAGTCALPAR